MKTSSVVSFGLFALEIKQDSSPAVDVDLQPFSKVGDLRTDNATSRPYATYEPDFWLLDGEYKFIPDDTTNVHVGLMSLAASDGDGNFATPPALTIAFSQAHSADGISLRFGTYSGDYASSIRVAFYDASDVLIRSDDYEPTDTEWFSGQAVVDFKKIVITFYSTNRPYRYLRVSGVDYGTLISFDGTSIKTASVIEEVNQLSTEVPFNTLELTLYSEDADFSILNPAGNYAALKYRQPLAVYENVDNARLFIGNFYLDEWENLTPTSYRFSAIDMLGVLDGIKYKGGIWTGAGIAIETLIEDLLGGINVPYELDSELIGTAVIGWLPPGTYRQALQQIGFGIGASVTCARNGAVRIMATRLASATTEDATLTSADKGEKSTVSLKTLVTGVEITAHNYVASTNSQELYNDSLAAGTYEIEWSDPMHDLSATGATISESGVNYAILEVTSPGTVVLSGQEYIDTSAITRITNPDLAEGVRPNVIAVDSASLVHSGNVAAVAQRVYDYYQQRYLQKMKLFAPSVEPGDAVLIDTLFGRQLMAVIEKMTLDLSGGFTAQVEATGVDNG